MHGKASKSEGKKIRILIVDDHAIIREGLMRIIQSEKDMEVAGSVKNASEAINELSGHPVDVVILDVNMPGRSGFDILKPVKELYPNMAVLVFSMHPERQYALRVLKAGAAGYLPKDSAPEQIVEAIRHVAGHRKYSSPTLAESISADSYDQHPHTVLSEREHEVMRMIGDGNTVTEIAKLLSLSVKTVSTYRRRIMQKMVWRSNSEIIRYVLQQEP